MDTHIVSVYSALNLFLPLHRRKKGSRYCASLLAQAAGCVVPGQVQASPCKTRFRQGRLGRWTQTPDVCGFVGLAGNSLACY